MRVVKYWVVSGLNYLDEDKARKESRTVAKIYGNEYPPDAYIQQHYAMELMDEVGNRLYFKMDKLKFY